MPERGRRQGSRPSGRASRPFLHRDRRPRFPETVIRLAERRPPSELPERMDRDDQDPELLDRALDALSRANRQFGGTRVVWRPLARALEALPPSSAGVRLLDVGAGGGDLGRELARRVRGRGPRVRLLLADRHGGTLRLARRRGRADGDGGGTGSEGGRSDVGPGTAKPAPLLRLRAGRLPLRTDAVDFVISASTLHHLSRSEALRFLREADRVAERGWIVTDLRRSWPTYLAVRALSATLWRDNPLPRRDGPRSVRRAFTRGEARGLLDEAGLVGARAEAARPFRIRLTGGEALVP